MSDPGFATAIGSIKADRPTSIQEHPRQDSNGTSVPWRRCLPGRRWPSLDRSRVRDARDETGERETFGREKWPRWGNGVAGAGCEAYRSTTTEIKRLKPSHHTWRVIRDSASDESTLEVVNDQGAVLLRDLDLEMRRKALEWYTYRGDDFNSVRGETLWERGLRRGDWRVHTVTRTVLTSTPDDFLLHAQLDAYEGSRRVYSDKWDITIPRHCV